MLLEDEIKKGEIYGYGINCSFDSLTYTAKIMEVNRHILTIECQQTKKVDTVGRHMLTPIDRCKKMYKTYEKEYQKIESGETELDSHRQWKVEREYKRLKKILEFINDNEEYQSREYCKNINCSIQQNLDENPKNKEDVEYYCSGYCKAYHFHQWLQENNYKIVKG